MSYHTLVYNIAAAGVNAVNSDLLAATDTEITQRNSHYTFTERYRMLAAAAVGVSVTRGRFQAPRWNAIGEFAIFNANRALTPPTNPQWDLYSVAKPEIPQMEEFQVQLSNNLGAGTEQESVVIQAAPDDWNANLDLGDLVLCVRATAAVTNILNTWSGPTAITLIQSLRGGVYAVLGAVVQGANGVAYRWIFPRNKMYHGRRLRPGGLVQTAIGDVINQQVDPYIFGWGIAGGFHTFELPQIEVFGTAAGATTYQVFLWIAHIGDDISLLNRYAS
jgi:hypothetical protein